MAHGFKTGGRQKGTKNKITQDIKALAQVHGEEAIETLQSLMRDAENEQTRVAAAKELLDRGYGKATQHIEAETTHRYVARVPEKAPDNETWLKRYAPPEVIQH